jgi:trk system potassium uptake protein TrkH
MILNFKKLKPVHYIPVSFLIAIIMGTILLMLPISSASGNMTDFLTALFTATTSVCVTGLVVVDTYAHWSFFGQLVILILIQIGGLGVVAVGSMIMVMTKRKLFFQTVCSSVIPLISTVKKDLYASLKECSAA